MQKCPIKEQYFAKETYNFKEPTNRSHPIADLLLLLSWIGGVILLGRVAELMCSVARAVLLLMVC